MVPPNLLPAFPTPLVQVESLLTICPYLDIIEVTHMEKKENAKPRETETGPSTMSESLRQAILASGKTLYRVSKDSGVSYAALHRFISGKRAVSMKALDTLCSYLGLTLTPETRKEGQQ